MNRFIYFLSGLQRSGATLLSSILNQNTDIWATPASPMLNALIAVGNCISLPENIDFPRTTAISTAMSAFAESYYSDRSEKVVIDKHLGWASPIGMHVAENYVSKNVKVICCVRSIPEILASYNDLIDASENNKNNQLDLNVSQYTPPYGSFNDRRADYLMRHDQTIMQCLNSMKIFTNPKYSKKVLFVEYDDLVVDTPKQMSRIYNFFNLPDYKHTYDNIVDVNFTGKESVMGIRDLHTVKSAIIKTSRNPSLSLTKETISRYSNLEFWRDDVGN